MIYLSAFEKHLKDEDRSPLTVAGYVRDVGMFAAWFEEANGKSLTPKLLTAMDARDYRQHLIQRQKASAATINRKLMALSAYPKWAVLAGHIEHNPTEKVKLVEQEAPAPKWLERHEQSALLRAAERALHAAQTEVKKHQALRNIAVLTLFMHTGLRISELCALEMGDLTLGERTGKLRVRLGKGSKQRDVPLNATALSALRGWLAARPKIAHSFVFTGKGGVRLRSSGVQEMVSEIGRRAGVEVTPHSLRHTFGKTQREKNVRLEDVARLMGHSNINITGQIYATPGDADLEKDVEMIGG